MDYLELSEATISERDKAFAQEFAKFVNGSMSSADQTGWVLTLAQGFLLLDMFMVFLGFMLLVAHNYQQGRYDDRNEWASRLSAEAYQRLIECDLIFDPEFPTSK